MGLNDPPILGRVGKAVGDIGEALIVSHFSLILDWRLAATTDDEAGATGQTEGTNEKRKERKKKKKKKKLPRAGTFSFWNALGRTWRK